MEEKKEEIKNYLFSIKDDVAEQMLVLSAIFENWAYSSYNLNKKKNSVQTNGKASIPYYQNPNTNSAYDGFLTGALTVLDLLVQDRIKIPKDKEE